MSAVGKEGHKEKIYVDGVWGDEGTNKLARNPLVLSGNEKEGRAINNKKKENCNWETMQKILFFSLNS